MPKQSSPDIRAVLMDLDGVAVLPDYSISPGVIGVMHELHEAGVLVAPVTGRDLKRHAWLLEPLGFKDLGVFNGGASIASFESGQTLWQQRIARAVAEPLIRQLMPYSEYMNFGEGGRLPIDQISADNLQGDALGIWAEVPDASLEVVRTIIGAVPDVQVHRNQGTVRPGLVGLHITHRDANKYWGAKRMLEMMGVAPGNALAIGDEDIDVPLLQAVGTGVAMANGSDALKRQAHYVTRATVHQDGLVEAIHEHVLGPLRS